VIELTDVRAPCRQLKQWDERMPRLIAGRSGWVAKVIREGVVQPATRSRCCVTDEFDLSIDDQRRLVLKRPARTTS
jgi:MOSC domain-containing protein YiiM